MQDLFWGPKFSIDYVRSQRKVEPAMILDDVWAEAGCVIDIDSNYFLFFDQSDLSSEVPLKRHYLKYLKHSWANWTVEWAKDCLATIVDYVNLPKQNLFEPQISKMELKYIILDYLHECNSIISMIDHDKHLSIFPIDSGDLIQYQLANGPELIEALEDVISFNSLDVSELNAEDGIRGGVHINLSDRQIDFWTIAGEYNLIERLQRKWPSWKVICHYDEIEVQEGLCNNELKLQRYSRSELDEFLFKSLLDDSSAVEGFMKLASRLAADGAEVRVSRQSLNHKEHTISKQQKSEILQTLHQYVDG